MLKILLLSTSSSRNAGGLYNSVRQLGKNLNIQNSVGLDPVVLAFRDERSDVDNKFYSPLKLVEYKIVGPSGIAVSFDLLNKIRQLGPDIIHIQGIWLFSSFINTKYCLKHKIPYIISPRGMLDPWILSVRSWKKRLGLYLYERKHLENATCIHALCEPEYKAIRKFGLKTPVAIIPNGVDLPSNNFKTPKNLPYWKKVDDRKNLLFLSRLHPKKGLENLIHSWNNLKEYHKEWKLIIAGESRGNTYKAELEDLVNGLNLSEHILFIGAQYHEEKELTFRLCDGFILPSYSEGMPMAVLEAWSYSLPVLITDDCNIKEGFENKAAIRIEANLTGLTKGLTVFFNLSLEERALMGANGFDLVKSKFTWEVIAKETANLYEWILDNSKDIPKCLRFK